MDDDFLGYPYDETETSIWFNKGDCMGLTGMEEDYALASQNHGTLGSLKYALNGRLLPMVVLGFDPSASNGIYPSAIKRVSQLKFHDFPQRKKHPSKVRAPASFRVFFWQCLNIPVPDGRMEHLKNQTMNAASG